MNAESLIWLVVGVYFLLVGWERLPLPGGGIADWFDVASQARFRLALRPLGCGLILIGLGFGLGVL